MAGKLAEIGRIPRQLWSDSQTAQGVFTHRLMKQNKTSMRGGVKNCATCF